MVSSANSREFSVTTNSFKANGTIPQRNLYNGFGCSGENISPNVEWHNPPAETASFAVTIYDPDAPTGSGWWHWTVFNIPSSVASLSEGASRNRDKMPQGAIEAMTDFGQTGYGGPCPPQGDKPHRYIITVYALKVPCIDLPPESPGAMVGFYLNQNALATTSVVGFYGR